MPHLWTKMRSFILNPATPTNLLFILFTFIAGILWIEEFSYKHPGPAIAVFMIAIAILVIGLQINDLRINNQALSRQINALQANNRKLGQKGGNLKKTNRMLLQKVDVLQAQCHDLQQRTPERQPRLIGLELLVERWQSFAPKQADSVILHEQFLIAQSIARLAYGQDSEIRFVNYFPGFKIKGGAFLIQPGQNMPLVLKFASVANIKAETDRYRHCVAGQLGLVPGEPLVPHQQYGKIEGEEWGAITYNLLGADQAEFEQLQTFTEYYSTHDEPQQIADALNKIFASLRPWWQNPPGSDNCGRWRRTSLYGEYDRLTRKQDQMQREIVKTGQQREIEALHNITPHLKHVNLNNNLRLRNPLNWIRDVFEARQLNSWINQIRLRRDSIVHGDLHAGNILISKHGDGTLRAWIIDFPHTHVGPTIQDIARLEADLKFGLLPGTTLEALDIDEIYQFETALLPKSEQSTPSLAELTPGRLSANQQIEPHLQKVWQAVNLLRDEARNYMNGFDARPYYLALLHASLPALYYSDRSSWQKLYAFISAALLCERLGG
jgi:hypothetical protein